MKKGIVVPLSSGYNEKAKGLSGLLDYEVDLRDIKAKNKMFDASENYDKVLSVGVTLVLNGVIIKEEDLMKKRKKKSVIIADKEYDINEEDINDDLSE